MRVPLCSFLALFLLLAGPAAAQEDPAQDHPAGTFVEKRAEAVLEADGVQRLQVLGGSYFFDPNVIVVKVNVPVELSLTKEPGFVPHNMLVEAPEAGISFNAEMKKKPSVVKFTPTKVGRYPISCDKRFLWTKTHKERGMEGFIDVVE
jgi:plastocyanin